MNFRNRIVVLIIAISLFSVACLQAEQSIRGRAKRNFRSAKMYFNRQNYEKAKPLYEKVLEKYPDHIESLKPLGDMAFKEAQEAIPANRIKFYSVARDYYIKVMKALENKENWPSKEKYVKYYERIQKDAKIKVKSVWARIYNMGLEEFSDEEYIDSYKIFNQLLEMTPDSVKAVDMLSKLNLTMSRGDSTEVIDYYKESVGKDDAVKYKVAKDFFLNRAVDNFTKLLDRNKEDIGSMRKLASLYFEINKLEEAAKWYEAILAISSSDAEIQFNLAVVYVKLQDDEKAYKQFVNVVNLEPKNESAVSYASDYAHKLGKKAESLKYKKMLADLKPDDKVYLQILCYSLYQEKSWDDLLKYGELWMKAEPKNKEIPQLLYQAASKKKNKKLMSKYSKLIKKLSK